MIKGIKLEIKGIEPVIIIKGTKGPRIKYTITYGLFHPFRRLIWKYKCWKKKKEIIKLGHKPYKCEGCGEGWAEWAIEDPNKPLGTYKKIFVCKECVIFYDWKWTHKRLYNEPKHFRG